MICCLVAIGNYFGALCLVVLAVLLLLFVCGCLAVLGFTFGLSSHWILLFVLGLLVV